MRRIAWLLAGCASAVVLAAGFALWPGTRSNPPPPLTSVRPVRVEPLRRTAAYRADALRRAVVWQAPPDRSRATLVATLDPGRTFTSGSLECRYLPERAQGTTSKFNCVLANGEVVKVKYGGTGEIQAEVAASRLLTRLGFAADRMFIVPRVRCYGCPHRPFELSWAADWLRVREPLMRRYSPQRYVDFTDAAVERRFPGAAIETDTTEGWAWYELDEVDGPGAGNAERDALRLVAVLLSHWDNKAANQRLVCLDGENESDVQCRQPLAMIHDLGATFGPNKVELTAWRATPVWNDPNRCTVTMRQFPYHGGTFADRQIGEAGRRLLAHELEAISEDDTRAWFESAGFRNASSWATAFLQKAHQIITAGPCAPVGERSVANR